MEKLKIAVLFGGCSSEHTISLSSGFAVISNMDPDKYDVIPVGITREGKWFRYYGEYKNIKEDSWYLDEENIRPCYILPDREIHGMIELRNGDNVFTRLDGVFPVLHGKNGEDGTVQGLIELAGIPVCGCGTLASAVCMDKYRAHALAEEAGVAIPKQASLIGDYSKETALEKTKDLTYPLFIKPVKAGSSYGISVIDNPDELEGAIAEALKYDNEIIIEEQINGFEVGCSIVGDEKGNMIAGRVDEIELFYGTLFDYERKYTATGSKIHTPARIDSETEDRIRETGKVLFKVLGCKGFARIDMFLANDGRIVFNEINTIPGFTEVSRFPKMMAGVGLDYKTIIDKIIEYSIGE